MVLYSKIQWLYVDKNECLDQFSYSYGFEFAGFWKYWLTFKKKYKVLLIEYKLTSIQMKFQVMIDANVNIRRRWICEMDNV